MSKSAHKAVAIVGVGAVMPDAPNATVFWQNIKNGRYSISDVPADRWNVDHYYDADPSAPDKAYSRIGGWVRDLEWEPLKWKLPIPPKVGDLMDLTQKYAIITARAALADFGYPERKIDPERTAVILGNAMGGDSHLWTAARIYFPEFADGLIKSPVFAGLPEDDRKTILEDMRADVAKRFPPITEDTMPGELSNVASGRIASLFNLRGPNYVADAACASAMAALDAAIEGLEEHHYDAVITGGTDANMSPNSYVKFCKIGALSATGTRPYAEGADGFVMGEGAGMFVIKRLEDAERDGDKIYAVIRSLGGSSDGKGKGITAPNPVGQKLAVKRAWENAGIAPAAGDLIEGHGTSTKVGDVVEVESLSEVLSSYGVPRGSVALGSVKSNVGHLKGAAGAAGMLKVAMSLHEKVIPPSVNFTKPNPGIDFNASPMRVNTELREWEPNEEGVRRAGVSAFGFGGTNFHVVMEEYIPGRLKKERKTMMSVSHTPEPSGGGMSLKAPLRGALVLGADSDDALRNRLENTLSEAKAGRTPAISAPNESDLRAAVRIAIDYDDAAELSDKIAKVLTALEKNEPGRWKMLQAKGIFIGRGAAAKSAFLFTGQGSQYVNMLDKLREIEPIVADTYAEADETMKPLLGKPLTDYIFVDENDEDAMTKAHHELKQTVITQPAVLATETAFLRLVRAYGIEPDMVMGHSLGEYGALVAAGTLPFADGLRAVSARGGAMTEAASGDNGAMAAVQATVENIERVISTVDGYVVVANNNSTKESVIGGATKAVEAAMEALRAEGYTVTQLPVSHAFHTEIVAAAAKSLVGILEDMDIKPPQIPVVANISGEFYPTGPGIEKEIISILARQVALPVQFVKGLNTLYDSGARVFAELGPKRALYGFSEAVVGSREGVTTLFTNHPRVGHIASFNQALCGLYAAGLGAGVPATAEVHSHAADTVPAQPAAAFAATAAQTPPVASPQPTRAAAPPIHNAPTRTPAGAAAGGGDRYTQLGHMFAEFLDRGFEVYKGTRGTSDGDTTVCVTGASVGLPGVEGVFNDDNFERILRGDQFIGSIPMNLRDTIADKGINRLVKGSGGEARFETINDSAHVLKLAGRASGLDLKEDFGLSEERLAAMDNVTQLAMAAGIDALRDAGIPLVMRNKKTTTGSTLPDRWVLPENMRDDTGIVFGSVFPGFDSFAEIVTAYERDRARRETLAELEKLRATIATSAGSGNGSLNQIDDRIKALRKQIDDNPHEFDRRFLFRVLAMGHSQFAEHIGARGPNSHVDVACATGPHSLMVAKDWIQTGKCRRVIVVTADNVTTDILMEWFGAGFLASGAAATDADVKEVAVPFDRRRHGMLIGMGGAAFVVESTEAANERGVRPICELLETVTSNSAFHGSRLDIEHICGIMENLMSDAEAHWGINRHDIARELVFVSHETYTPARGGSASAEVFALRRVFGKSIDDIVIANTKGFTGHPMGAGIEDAVGMKILETGVVPPVPNYREVDPELGTINLSKGGAYPVRYALRLGAGFGSQITMALLRWVPSPDGHRPHPHDLGVHNRIADPAVWQSWLANATGVEAPELEVVKRTLRVKDDGLTTRKSRPSAGAPAAIPVPPAPDTRRPAPVHVTPAPVGITPAPDVPRAAPAEATPAAVVPSAAPVEVAPAPATSPTDAVQEEVLRIVAEKTGYPPDMLDLDLDLEADLGIDTVKQAEMFASIREKYDIPRDDNLKLRDYPTLAKTVQFVYDKRPDLLEARAATVAAAPSEAAVAPTSSVQPTASPVPASTPPAPADAAATPPAETVPTATTDEVTQTILSVVAEQTGYPPDMLDLDLDLEADLGIDTVKQAEMFAAIRAAYDIPRDDNLQLRNYPTLAHTIEFVYEKRPDLRSVAATPAAATQVPSSASPEAATEATPAAQASSSDDEVTQTVLQIVAEQTGYPPDMLDLDLDLEADLGIDTVKQAEMFAAIRAKYDIPRDDNLQLREYPTLAHTIQFVHDRRPATAATAAADRDVSTSPATARDAVDAVPRRVPMPRLRPALEWCKPTGVKLEAGTRVLVMMDRGGVGRALVGRLEKLGVEALIVDDTPDADTLNARINKWKADGPVHGVYWLSALDEEAAITDMDLESWRAATHARVKLLYHTMRELYDNIGESHTFLVSATRLGGQHGYDAAGAVAPLGGAVTGFTKAFKREKNNALVKAVDFEASRKTAAFADILVEETLSDPGVLEIGYQEGLRWAIGLADAPMAPDSDAGVTLDGDTVFLITGAAGGIVSAITADLAAAASGGTFHLLDLAAAPARDDAEVALFTSDKDALKRDLFEKLKARGERATPIMVEKELGAIERRHAAMSAIEAIEKAGGTAHYHSVNMLDGDAMTAVMKAVAAASGRIDVLLHAAGLEVSRSLPKKEPAEFERVFDVKSDGWFNIIANLGDMSLRSAIVFSSIAGRFGNMGQTDYSSANDLLCKFVSNFRTSRPGSHAVAIDWTAWGDIGMATRGSIPDLLAGAGIDMIPPDAGIRILRRELTEGTGGEVVIATNLGSMLDELDDTGGIDIDKLQTATSNKGVMTQRIVGMGVYGGLVVETTLDPTEQPFLYDHQIDGTPVLPGVMGIEALVEAATLIFPDFHVGSVENVDFASPFKFYRSEPRTVRLHALFEKQNGDVVANCRLVGERKLHGREEPEVTTHFTARVRLLTKAPRSSKGARVEAPTEASRLESGDIYKLYFHGPAYQVVENSWRAGAEVMGTFNNNLPANHAPSDLPELVAPRLIELCFQTAGISEMAGNAAMGLPHHIDEVEFLKRPSRKSKQQYYAAVSSDEKGAFDARVIDDEGNVYLTLRGYRTMQLPGLIEDDLLRPLKEKMTRA